MRIGETSVLILILLITFVSAGRASFTHVHDWTMRNSPPGTGDWFGWTNAVISELIPIAAMLVMRRRRREQQSIAYPVLLLIASLALSITAQLAVAKPGLSGGVVAVIPALAFAALAKLVFGKPPKRKRQRGASVTVPTADATPVVAASVKDVQLEVSVQDRPEASRVPSSAQDDQTDNPPAPKLWPTPPLPLQLLDAAQRAADQHLAETGRVISRDELQKILRVSNATTGEVMRALDLRDAPLQLATTPAAISPLTGKPLL
ncbi:hypothetical protein [Allorhizocola rhizosphaerae]|uniref:hypothetical protein n=1 Tax=Allorhizocola rhizosphaerae TaxID=1872709 RepID=UPI001FEB2565|nr:hypothetical protein [Allorhizocola rhizosphaerae]